MRTCSRMPYHIGVKMKIYPSYEQQRIIAINAGAERAVYNLLVKANNEIYRLRKTADTVSIDRERIDYLRSKISSHSSIKNTLPYLYEKEVDSMTVANAMKDYRMAWKNVKEKHAGLPSFHKKSEHLVWHTNGHYRSSDTDLQDGSVCFNDLHHIRLPKIGHIRFDGSPKIIEGLMAHTEQTRIGTITISRDACGEYWCSLQISSETPFREKKPKTGSRIGIDLNLLTLVDGSDGQSIVNPKFHSSAEKKIKKMQRRASRKAERAKKEKRKLSSSQNYQKARKQLARLQRKAARQRDDYLNRISHDLIENQDLIVAEDLQVRNMLKNHKLAKAISDAGWRMLLTQLQQKGDMYGRTVILVPAKNTTQTCSVCGFVMKGENHLTLSDREWTCPRCGTHHFRDQNAGLNILAKGMKQLKIQDQLQ